MKNKNVAIVFDDLTEFFVMRDAIDAMLKEKIPVDIIVPYDSGYNGLAEHTYNKIKEFGYSPKKDAPKNKTYKILLTPYPGLNVVKRINYIYHIRYPYGAVSAKPNPTYLPNVLLDYDAIITFNNYDKVFYGAYGGKIYSIPCWQYANFKNHKNNSDKPTLLILPTFGTDTSLISHLNDDLILSIKKHFHVITKAHHATHFGLDGEKAHNYLKEIADEFFDSDTPVYKLLEKADLVLSDNSGAIFDSLYAGVPVVVFSQDPNSRHLGKIDTLQSQLIKRGVLPHTNQPGRLIDLLLDSTSFAKKQKATQKELFPKITNNPLKEFITIIKHYILLDETQDYYKILHDIMVKEWYDDKQKINNQKAIIEKQQQEISAILNSTSWKITEPIRKLKTTGRKYVKK